MNVPLVDLARRMIRIPSVSTEGTLDVACFLRDAVLAESDLDVRLEPGADPRQVNLVATKGLGGEPPILLNSHLDTVPPGDAALWTACGGDPFAGRLEGGRLYGLGSADAKLDALSKALALLRFRGRRFRRGVVFAGTFGEERGLLGARALLGRLPARPVAAWAGEPTALELVTRHKGFLLVRLAARDRAPLEGAAETTRLVARGRSAHSSTPALGVNAAFRALDLVGEHGLRIVRIEAGDADNKVPDRCDFEVAGRFVPPADPSIRVEGRGRATPMSSRLQGLLVDAVAEVRRIAAEPPRVDEEFSPPVRTANVGRITATAAAVELTVDVRSLPGDGAGDARERLEELAARHRARGVDVELSVDRDNPPLDTPSDALPVVWSVATLAALGRPSGLHTKAGCTEAGLYAAAGIPAVVFGPGTSTGNVHAPNERVEVADLEGAVEFYASLIAEVCAA